MHRTLWACALAIVAARASAQQPDTLRLTRASAVELARTRNPQLTVAREQIAQFRAARVQAVAIPDIAGTFTLDSISGPFRTGPGTQRNFGAALQVPFPDKFRLRNDVATADIRNSQANYAALDRQIAAQAAEQYDSLLVALKHQGDFNEALQLAQQFLTRTQARFEEGTAPRLDVIKAQVDVARATNDLIANERGIANAQSALNRLIARPLGAPIVATDSLSVPAGLPPLEALEALALRSRPELAGLEAERQGARAATTLAREFWLPDLTFGFSRDVSAGAGPGIFSTGVAFPIPLLFWQHTRGEVSQAAHHERELAASYEDLRAQVGQDVRNAYASASTALRQATYIRDQLLPSALAAYRAAAASYAIGGSSAFEVIDARRTLLDAQSQYADALASANTSRSDLQRAVGAPLDTIAPGATRVP